ncbi:MAG: alcohol dehydrogenase [Epulopiscium sp. Nuni2H_MBin003]|nr:MAG: alcohol dehydrogenase [Epulopiscium sp. Nuni2H_MBin003]
MKEFELKTKIIFEENAIDYVSTINQKVFIISDPYIIESGMIDTILTKLEQEYEIFSDISPDPSIETVTAGVSQLLKFDAKVIIAVGGGSAIDAAKAIMEFTKQLQKTDKFKFIAIPTTSGTGSEVTSFSVVTDKSKAVKYPLISDSLLPDVAILDTIFVKSVPPHIVADTGIDVLTHALEAYVSTNATVFSDALAEKAVQLVFKYLYRAYKYKDDLEAKENMHYASCLAGISFNTASLGINHAIAHVMGAKLSIPHGRTNSLLLPRVIEFNANITGYANTNYSIAATKYAHLAYLVGIQAETVRLKIKKFVGEIEKLQRHMNMPTKISECNIDKYLLDKVKEDIAEAALLDACIATNPRQATKSDVLEIIRLIK